MIACALMAAPKLRPQAGMPPMTPGSAVRVSEVGDALLGGDRGDALGHADAEVDDGVGFSSSAARRAMILRSPIGSGASVFIGTRISPAKAAL